MAANFAKLPELLRRSDEGEVNDLTWPRLADAALRG